MRNAGLEEAQAGIKIAGRNINNLRYADDTTLMASLLSQLAKNPPAMPETWVRSLRWKDPLEEGMAARSSILAWRIPMDRSLTGCSPRGCRVGRHWAPGLSWNGIPSDPGFFRLLALSYLSWWAVLLDVLFPRGPRMAVIVLLNNSNQKLPRKNRYFHLSVFLPAQENLSQNLFSKLSLLPYWPELDQMLIAKAFIGRRNGNCHNWFRLELFNPGVKYPFVLSLLEEAFFLHVFWFSAVD